MLEPDLISDFMENFFGYGDLASDIWFVGMEESGGKSCDDVARRLNTWKARGSRALEDVAEYHDNLYTAKPQRDLESTKLIPFREAKRQNTWDKLIRTELGYRGQDAEKAASLEFQRETWGRTGSRTCLLELMPLPAQSTSAWRYHDWVDDPRLGSRGRYMIELAKPRIDKLRDLISRHEPKAVIFYSKTYRPYWGAIAQVAERDWESSEPIRRVKRDGITFVEAPHPVARGVKNDDFVQLGRRLRGDLVR